MLDKVALPTVGRIVYYHDPEHVEPLAGIVAVADANRYTIPVLHVFLRDGARVVESVPHKDEVAKDVEAYPYWDWMDYQKGQAAKTEALQAELEKSALQMGRQSIDDRELSKTQRSTPSPEDGKR